MAENQAENHADPIQNPPSRPPNLPLPKQFDGTGEGWIRWRARFERYRICVGLSLKPEREQISCMLYSMGDIADDLLVMMNVNEATITYNELLAKFDAHFNARKNVITIRAKFNKRSQRQGEKIDSFIQDLHRLADDCEYEGLKEQLIRDRIVAGVSDNDLSEKLQSLADLTLEVAKQQARQWESRKEEQDIIRGKSVDAIKAQAQGRSKSRASPSHSNSHYNPPKAKHPHNHRAQNQRPKPDKCRYCGKGPHANRQSCPAYGETCKAYGG